VNNDEAARARRIDRDRLTAKAEQMRCAHRQRIRHIRRSAEQIEAVRLPPATSQQVFDQRHHRRRTVECDPAGRVERIVAGIFERRQHAVEEQRRLRVEHVYFVRTKAEQRRIGARRGENAFGSDEPGMRRESRQHRRRACLIRGKASDRVTTGNEMLPQLGNRRRPGKASGHTNDGDIVVPSLQRAHIVFRAR
jgi:hypothetical protein